MEVSYENEGKSNTSFLIQNFSVNKNVTTYDTHHKDKSITCKSCILVKYVFV